MLLQDKDPHNHINLSMITASGHWQYLRDSHKVIGLYCSTCVLYSWYDILLLSFWCTDDSLHLIAVGFVMSLIVLRLVSSKEWHSFGIPGVCSTSRKKSRYTTSEKALVTQIAHCLRISYILIELRRLTLKDWLLETGLFQSPRDHQS